MNLSHANKKLFTVSLILYLHRMLPIIGIHLKGELSPNNNPRTFCFLINLDILQRDTGPLFFVLTPRILISVFFSILQTIR